MIRSGISEIDGFLHGGLRGGFITDIYGAPASGKTQLAFQICANALTSGGSVLFEDTKGEFRPERILQMLGARGMDETHLERIKVLRITNSNEQLAGIDMIGPGFSLVVIDGISELFSFEFHRDYQAPEKNRLFMKYMHCLSRAAIEYGIPVVVTNTVRTIDETETENLARAISPFTHLKIRLANSTARTGTIQTAGRTSDFGFVISGAGVEDAPDSTDAQPAG